MANYTTLRQWTNAGSLLPTAHSGVFLHNDGKRWRVIVRTPSNEYVTGVSRTFKTQWQANGYVSYVAATKGK